MTIHRFLIENAKIDLDGGTIEIVDARQVKQISRVLRLGPGDCIDVVDESGKIHRLSLEGVSSGSVVGRILSTVEPRDDKPFKITVVLALLKGGNFESTITKLTEIGVDVIMPVLTERTVVKLDAEADNKMRRWMSIIKEAVEQSERPRSPHLVAARSLKEALNDLTKADNQPTIFICAERSQAPHLVTIVYRRSLEAASPAVPPSDICIVIGPEGGFTEQEIDHAISIGCIPCRLGGNILRSETAATVAATLVASFGEFLCENQK